MPTYKYKIGDRVIVSVIKGDSADFNGSHGTIEQLGGAKWPYDGPGFKGAPDYRLTFDSGRSALIWEFNIQPEYELGDIQPNISFINELLGD